MMIFILYCVIGIVFVFGGVIIVWGLMVFVVGNDVFVVFMVCVGSLFGLLVLFGWIWVFVYYLCNGICYLVQDIGVGYVIFQFVCLSWLLVIGSVVIILLVWGYVLMIGGVV